MGEKDRDVDWQMQDDCIFIQVPYCDEEGTIRIALHKMFCGVEGCHSVGFELKGDSNWCKKCGALKSYRLRPEEEAAIMEKNYLSKSYITRH